MNMNLAVPRPERNDPIVNVGKKFLIISFFLFGFLSEYIVPERYSLDYEKIIKGVDGDVDLDASFAAVSNFIGFFSIEIATAIVFCVALTICFILLNSARTRLQLLCVTLLLIGTLPNGMYRAQKEMFVYMLTLAVYFFVVRFVGQKKLQIFWILLFYFSYYFLTHRPYYIIIILVFASFQFMRTIALSGRIALSILGLIALALGVPDSVWQLLHASRDSVNVLRLAMEIDEARSAFNNLLPAAGLLGFLVNWLYAGFRLSFPIFFDQTVNELYLTMLSCSMLYFVFCGYRIGRGEHSMFLDLIVSHMVVLWIFEPDLGSYVRHVSSILLYFAPIFMVLGGRSPGGLMAKT